MPKRADAKPAGGADLALWEWAMRGVEPLAPRPAAPKPSPPPARKAAARAAPLPGPGFHDLPPLTLDRFAGIDRASSERLKRGRLPIEARLDLHGMTQAEAHRAL